MYLLSSDILLSFHIIHGQKSYSLSLPSFLPSFQTAHALKLWAFLAVKTIHTHPEHTDAKACLFSGLGSWRGEVSVLYSGGRGSKV